MLELDLPFPPSINHYYGGTRSGRRYISQAGKRYRQQVAAAFSSQGGTRQHGLLAFFGVGWPKDRRKRDLDNHFGKALLDALQLAGAFDDDSQIVALSSRWEIEAGEIKRHPEGLIHIRIVQAGGT